MTTTETKDDDALDTFERRLKALHAQARVISLPMGELLAWPRELYAALYRGWREIPPEMAVHQTHDDATRGQMALDAAAVLLGMICRFAKVSDEELMRHQRDLWLHVFGDAFSEDEMVRVQQSVDTLLRYAMKGAPS